MDNFFHQLLWECRKSDNMLLLVIDISLLTCLLQDRSSAHEVLNFLPTIPCITPEEALHNYNQGIPEGRTSDKMFKSWVGNYRDCSPKVACQASSHAAASMVKMLSR